ncbi:MAG: ABC transporter ATP-binding protein [Saprospiraceae bacterium]|nr:ABC transporter ATP-binding protein [Saprospiraceae bacterium]MCB9327282.1 ABC transporter ATP-binding protein [Lewinellaceae bacterium]
MSIISNILVSIFTVVSIPLFQPFLEILFDTASDPNITKPEDANISELINYHLAQLINTSGRHKALLYACLFIVIVFFLKNIFRYFAAFFMVKVRNGIITDIRKELFNKFLNLPLSYISENRKGDLMSRLTTDVVEIEWSILNMIDYLFKSPIIIIGCVAYMIYVSPPLTLFVLALMIFTVVIIGGISKTLKKSSTQVQQHLSNINSITEETLGGLRIIKGFNAENHQLQKFNHENSGFYSSLNKLLYRRELSSPLSEFLGITLVTILLWYGGNQVLDENLNAAAFLTYIFAFFSVIEPSKSLSTAYYNIQKGKAALERVDDILNTDGEYNDVNSKKEKIDFNKEISLEHVTFSYDQENLVIDDFNLIIPKGKIVALVGSSGAGKSTLVDLIPRFRIYDSGSIKIDGRDILKLDLRTLRSLFGIVTQDAVLFNDSIRNNISFGENYTNEQIIEAAKIANIHDFIVSLPDAYDTNIGDRGMKLSGGQRQRLTIARAILRNPPILILDEATSALDSESEKLVQQALERVMKSRTSIIIAHRLSTIKGADTIVVMENGKIVEQGTHENLLEIDGFYKKFVEMQSFA